MTTNRELAAVDFNNRGPALRSHSSTRAAELAGAHTLNNSWLEEIGYTPSIIDRLESKLVRSDNGCLIWTGGHHLFGHGLISRGRRGTGKEATHRLMWMLTNGPIPDGMWILHHCDNPPCCEPSHLIRRRGRFNPARGQANARWRIPDHKIRQIRSDYRLMGSYAAVARLHEIDNSYVKQIVTGRARSDA